MGKKNKPMECVSRVAQWNVSVEWLSGMCQWSGSVVSDSRMDHGHRYSHSKLEYISDMGR